MKLLASIGFSVLISVVASCNKNTKSQGQTASDSITGRVGSQHRRDPEPSRQNNTPRDKYRGVIDTRQNLFSEEYEYVCKSLISGTAVTDENISLARSLMDTGPISDCIDLLDRMPFGDLRSSLLERFASRYAKEDLKAACEWLTRLIGDNENIKAYASVGREAARDPDFVLNIMSVIQSKELANRFFLSFLAGSASNNFSETVAILESGKFDSAISKANKSALLNILSSAISAENIQQDLMSFCAYADKSGNASDLAFEGLGNALRQLPSVKIESLINSIGNSPSSLAAIKKINQVWAKSDPTIASQWLQTQSGLRRDNATAGFAEGISESDPRLAVEWALSIQNTQVKANTINAIYKNQSANNPEIINIMEGKIPQSERKYYSFLK